MSEEPLIVSSPDTSDNNSDHYPGELPKRKFKKVILFISLFLTIIFLVLAIYFVISKYKKNDVINNPIVNPIATSSNPVLPKIDNPVQDNNTSATSTLSNLAIEYLSFADFYNNPIEKVEIKINDYELPINAKEDVMNYFDVSRKINIDTGLEDLNNKGFTLIENPWANKAPDFYSIYSELDSKQIPVFVSSDFIIYYYQNNLKKAFKDIEENIFYDNLWDITKNLYTASKNRYEARLASIGNINDSVLEGERLEMAFFSVALELLKPAQNQIMSKGENNSNKFSANEASRFYFVVPTYLRDDVAREVKLVRASSEKIKSPILLYVKDYNDFTVPSDYRSNAKLNNFYLTTKWLNSVFPIEYKSEKCPLCLLDKEDGRINLIAASFITYDFANLPELKNKWARIYKVLAFFKGLRDDLNYLYYQEALTELFGNEYKIEEIFNDKNKEQKNNLEKLRLKLLAYDFSEAQGGFNKSNLELKNNLGFKMLVESYWPNDYIFNNLTKPSLGVYLGTSMKANNISACLDRNRNLRCNGVALDVINLAVPVLNNDFFIENSNYTDYVSKSQSLRDQLDKDNVWQTSNYWANLKLTKSLLNINTISYPVFARSDYWQNKSLNTAVATWVNMQLPLENISLSQSIKDQGLNNFSQYNENSYIEPNLELLNELIANNNMIIKMFAALRINEEINFVSQNLQVANNNLLALKRIVLKELSGVDLSSDDNSTISNFIKQWEVTPGSNFERQLNLKTTLQKTGLRENLSQLKLLVLVHKEGNNKVFSVGPVWNNIENR